MKFLQKPKVRYGLTVSLVFFLFSGQGIRYLVGLPAYGVLALALLLGLWFSFRGSFKRGQTPILLIVFVALAFVTLFWSQTTLVTAVALLILLATSLAALVVTWGLDQKTLFMGIFRGLQLSLIVGVAFELVAAFIVRGPISPVFHEWLQLVDTKDISPSVLQWSSASLLHGGPLEGFSGNRNLFGFIALLSGIMAPLAWREGLIKLWQAVLTVAIALAVHLLTGSATVTFIAVSVGILAVAAHIIRGAPLKRRRMLSWSFVGLAGAAALVSYQYRDVVTLMLGREPDLTNRTEIWRKVFNIILDYPQGTGWVSYWPVWEPPYKDLVAFGGTPVAQAHNAFLDVWLQIGPLAVIVLLGLFVVTLISGWELVETENHGETVMPLAWVLLTVALGLQAITESRLLLEGNWFLLVVAAASVPQLISNRGFMKARHRAEREVEAS